MSNNQTDLKPCPFCGKEAAWGEGEQKTKYGNEQVYCKYCYAMTAPEMTKSEAAERWNTRANADTEREWVPVSERLPEKEGRYLTHAQLATAHESIGITYLANSGTDPWWVTSNPKPEQIIAWQPLPEPYQPALGEEGGEREAKEGKSS